MTEVPSAPVRSAPVDTMVPCTSALPDVLPTDRLLADGKPVRALRDELRRIDDVRNAGAEWEDAEVVVDGNLVSSRHPADLPAFTRELIGVAERVAEPVAG